MSQNRTKNFINGETALAGVIGRPVSHSRSPMMHNYWCQEYNVNGVYVALPAQNHLKDVLKGLLYAGFSGVNITIPYKEEAYQLCDHLTDIAQLSGSVNTLFFKHDKIYGDCTDGHGFCENLKSHHIEYQKKNVLILGAGGAARAIMAALIEADCDISISNRTYEKAENLVKTLKNGTAIEWNKWPKLLKKCDILINASSLGMSGKNNLDWDDLLKQGRQDLCVADIVYVPLKTALLSAAEKRDMTIIDGLGMLIHQARLGFYGWFGVMPEISPEGDNRLYTILARDIMVS